MGPIMAVVVGVLIVLFAFAFWWDHRRRRPGDTFEGSSEAARQTRLENEKRNDGMSGPGLSGRET